MHSPAMPPRCCKQYPSNRLDSMIVYNPPFYLNMDVSVSANACECKLRPNEVYPITLTTQPPSISVHPSCTTISTEKAMVG